MVFLGRVKPYWMPCFSQHASQLELLYHVSSSCEVVGITKTSNNHESILEKVGSSSRFSVQTAAQCKGKKFQNVVFCAPPSGFDDYPGAVLDAITNLWAGEGGGGSFVFTSSGGM
jgi:hypothetical protein